MPAKSIFWTVFRGLPFRMVNAPVHQQPPAHPQSLLSARDNNMRSQVRNVGTLVGPWGHFQGRGGGAGSYLDQPPPLCGWLTSQVQPNRSRGLFQGGGGSWAKRPRGANDSPFVFAHFSMKRAGSSPTDRRGTGDQLPNRLGGGQRFGEGQTHRGGDSFSPRNLID